jgi:hypothetical protein
MEKGALHFGRRVDSLVYQDNGDVSEVVLKFEDGSKVTGDASRFDSQTRGTTFG